MIIYLLYDNRKSYFKEIGELDNNKILNSYNSYTLYNSTLRILSVFNNKYTDIITNRVYQNIVD